MGKKSNFGNTPPKPMQPLLKGKNQSSKEVKIIDIEAELRKARTPNVPHQVHHSKINSNSAT